ncbi:MAG: response regulator receiver protein [Rhodospirillales bacterium]|nr:response regulator receiver protein [Rhodospirillales bacterium]
MPVGTAELSVMAVVLLVEDEVFIREVAAMTLAELGHDTLSAGDVDEALLHLRSLQHIDALVTDIRLKKLISGGYDLAREGVKLRPNMRVLYLTGNSVTVQMTDSFVEGARFLQKPYEQYQLKNSLKELFAAPS